MSEDNDHVKTLVEGLNLLVIGAGCWPSNFSRRRRQLNLLGVQNAIAAVEEAIKHERSLAARPQKDAGHKGGSGQRTAHHSGLILRPLHQLR